MRSCLTWWCHMGSSRMCSYLLQPGWCQTMPSGDPEFSRTLSSNEEPHPFHESSDDERDTRNLPLVVMKWCPHFTCQSGARRSEKGSKENCQGYRGILHNVKRWIHQGDIGNPNVCAPKNRAAKHVKHAEQKPIELNRKINKSTVIVEDFSTLLVVIDRTTDRKSARV